MSKDKTIEFPADLEERAKNSIRWLYGGNYIQEQVEDFNKILSLFAKQAFLEQENLIDILLYFFQKDEYVCLDEDEVLSEVQRLYDEAINE